MWETIVINNAPRLFGFGFSQFEENNEKKLYIVGGSDGDTRKAETWELDFDKLISKNLECDLQEIALNKVCLSYNPKKKERTLFSFGGSGSFGTNFQTENNLKQWATISESVQVLNVIQDDDMLFLPSFYIPPF